MKDHSEFQVGKWYKYNSAGLYLCVGFDQDKKAVLQGSLSKSVFVVADNQVDRFEEYKEPVVHKRKVVFLRDRKGKIYCIALKDQSDESIRDMYRSSYVVVDIQEVSFTEK